MYQSAGKPADLGKVREIFNFFKNRGFSGNVANYQGNLKFCVNVRKLSGNFENTRFKSS